MNNSTILFLFNQVKNINTNSLHITPGSLFQITINKYRWSSSTSTTSIIIISASIILVPDTMLIISNFILIITMIFIMFTFFLKVIFFIITAIAALMIISSRMMTMTGVFRLLQTIKIFSISSYVSLLIFPIL